MRVLKNVLFSVVLSLILLLLSVGFAFAQSVQSAANKSWNDYWRKFNTAVKTQNRKSLITLTSKKFFSPDGEKISGWINDQNSWRRMKNSVNKGTKSFACKKICRITRNADSTFGLVFVFENNRWGFIGERGE